MQLTLLLLTILNSSEDIMTFAGYLSEYSFAEILNFIRQGDKTGLLSILPDINLELSSTNSYYLWFQHGRIVGLAHKLNGRGLLDKIANLRYLPSVQIEQLRTQVDNLTQPLGLHLKSNELLTAEQLKFLFDSQSIVGVCKLCEISTGQFNFDPHILPAHAEMTGISLPAHEVGLLGLRMLKDWNGLSAKLPNPEHVLQRLSPEQPSFRLDTHELNLWKLADGKTPIKQLASQMKLPIESIRHISFRLIAFDVIHDLPAEVLQPALDPHMVMPELLPLRSAPVVSGSFLGNLMGFLKKKSAWK